MKTLKTIAGQLNSLVCKTAVIAFAATLLSACSDGGREIVPLDFASKVRVVHATVDAPKVDLLIDGNEVGPATGFEYGGATPIIGFPTGNKKISVQAYLPNDVLDIVLGPVDLMAEADTIHDVFVVGTVDDSDMVAFETYAISRPETFSDGQARVTVAHLAPEAGMVDIYLTAPGAALGAAAGSASYKESLSPATVAPGDYQVRVTAAGDATVIYDSGTLSLLAGQDWVLAAVSNPVLNGVTAQSPISLLAINNSGDTLIYSADDGASMKAVHAAVNTGAIDIVADDNTTTPLVSNLSFPNVADFVKVPFKAPTAEDIENDETIGLTDIKVYAAGTTVDPVIETSGRFANGSTGLTIALNTLDMATPPAVSSDAEVFNVGLYPRNVATEAKLRLIHASHYLVDAEDASAAAASEEVDTVDVYITAETVPYTSDTAMTVTELGLKENTGYFQLTAGSYDITMTKTIVTVAEVKDMEGTVTTPEESETFVVFGPLTVTVENGRIYDVIARDEVGLMGANVIQIVD